MTLVPLVQRENASSTAASMSASKTLVQLAKSFDVVLVDAGNGSENVAAVTASSEETPNVMVVLVEDERQQNSAQTTEIVSRLNNYGINLIRMAQMFAAP